MIPPLPPPMPPWPGGKPPWEQAREAQEKQEAERREAERQKAEAERQQAEQKKAAEQQALYQQFLASLRPQIMHGLVPPQMLSPTYANWITPQPYFRQYVPTQLLQQPPRQQLQPQPPPQPQPQPQAQQQAQAQVQPGPGGAPMQVARTEEQPSEAQPFLPVLPVSGPGLPFGARERHYWRHGVLHRQ